MLRKYCLLAAFSLCTLGTTNAALAQFNPLSGLGKVGTKFCCCYAQTASNTEGGFTVWTRTLADRALTQVDAKARCGLHTMFWNTHNCPQSNGEEEESGVSPLHATRFYYDGGEFGIQNGIWLEFKNGQLYAKFRHLERTKDFIYIRDDNRRIIIALGREAAFIRSDGETQFRELLRGHLR
jgi:hypothetical protein